jgi:hypothetical protein
MSYMKCDCCGKMVYLCAECTTSEKPAEIHLGQKKPTTGGLDNEISAHIPARIRKVEPVRESVKKLAASSHIIQPGRKELYRKAREYSHSHPGTTWHQALRILMKERKSGQAHAGPVRKKHLTTPEILGFKLDPDQFKEVASRRRARKISDYMARKEVLREAGYEVPRDFASSIKAEKKASMEVSKDLTGYCEFCNNPVPKGVRVCRLCQKEGVEVEA